MFLAVRDLKFAKGRFTLIAGVIAMITLLVVMLTGLSAGLARESVAAISTLGERGITQIGFSKPALGQAVGFDSSQVTNADVTRTGRQMGVDRAAMLTFTPARAKLAGVDVSVQVFSATQNWVMPQGISTGRAVVGQGFAKTANAKVGQRLTIGDVPVTIARISADASYQHTPVVWLTAADARAAGIMDGTDSHNAGSHNAGAHSVVVAKTSGGFNVGQAAHQTEGMTFMSPTDAIGTIESYKAENGSLTLMRVMLLIVSALVVGAFFTVWTIQRTPDLAVLKAMGAKTSTLMTDAVGQAAMLLLIGGGLGAGIAVVAGIFAGRAVPFVMTVSTTLTPLALLIALGLIGTLVSVRRISTIDPTTALGALR